MRMPDLAYVVAPALAVLLLTGCGGLLCFQARAPLSNANPGQPNTVCAPASTSSLTTKDLELWRSGRNAAAASGRRFER
jgi:hypothetical protein